MKSGPLHRRTPLTRKTEIKRVSDKTRKLIDEWGPVRKAFLEEMRAKGAGRGCCVERHTSGHGLCLGGMEVHEITRGSNRQLGFVRRVTWLAVCQRHHDLFDDYSRFPPERQLALKLCSDPEYYDRVLVNQLRGRSANAITLADVAAYLTVV